MRVELLPPGVTYRQYDYWTRNGLIDADLSDVPEGQLGTHTDRWGITRTRTHRRPGSGRRRGIDHLEWLTMAVMAPWVKAGLTPHAAATLARALITDGQAVLAGHLITPIERTLDVTKLASALPKDKNGLEAIAGKMLANPHEQRVVIAVVDISQVTTKVDDDTEEATIRVREIEALEGTQAEQVRQILVETRELRTGSGTLPFDESTGDGRDDGEWDQGQHTPQPTEGELKAIGGTVTVAADEDVIEDGEDDPASDWPLPGGQQAPADPDGDAEWDAADPSLPAADETGWRSSPHDTPVTDAEREATD